MVARKLIQSILIFVLLDQCQGGRFYCRPRSPLTVFIGRSSHTRQPDNFVFEEELEAEPRNSARRRCSWVLELDSPTPRQVLLRGILRSSLQDVREADSNSKQTQTGKFIATNEKFKLDGFRNCMKYARESNKLNTNTFVLLSLHVRAHVTLSMDLPYEIEKPPVAIAVTALEPGYCAQDMVLNNGQCYAVIEQQSSSLTDVLQVISNSRSAGMQLARFSSLEGVRNFVKLNYEPEFDLPPKQPINFTKLVRIGLFFSRRSSSVFELIATETGCERKRHPKSEEFVSAAKLIDGPCGALQGENAESVGIRFVNCSLMMPSLISFPEIPANSTCTDCDDEVREIRDWIREMSDQTTNYPHLIVTVCSALTTTLLVILMIVTLLIRCYHRRNLRIRRRNQSLHQGEDFRLE